MRFAHAGLTVGDLDRVSGFLITVLGFTLVNRVQPPDATIVERITGVQGARVEIINLRRDDCGIELLRYDEPVTRGRISARPCDMGYAHLAFFVADIDPYIIASAPFGFLPMAPAATVGAGPNIGMRAVYLRDHEGLTVELMQPRADPAISPSSQN